MNYFEPSALCICLKKKTEFGYLYYQERYCKDQILVGHPVCTQIQCCNVIQ